MNVPPAASSPRSAFTLIELLAVIAVMAVVIAFAVPATNQILRGSQLTQGIQLVGDQIGYARQLAMSKNRTIEVRFYRYGDPETPGEDPTNAGSGKWRAFQLFELLDNGAVVPASTFQRLPRMVVLDGGKNSTLLAEDFRGKPKKGSDDETNIELPVEINGRKVEKNYEWVSFRFLPDGSTNLSLKAVGKAPSGGGDAPNDSWFITVVNLTDLGKELPNINFAVLQLDPVTGTLKTFRPTAG